ncbi:Glycosyltransferase family 92 [Trinorchestia longiramus]|nr:Glycosyltransferase family 92 [Trinorchestia longiramus]
MPKKRQRRGMSSLSSSGGDSDAWISIHRFQMPGSPYHDLIGSQIRYIKTDFEYLTHFIFYLNPSSPKLSSGSLCSCHRVNADPASKFTQDELSKKDPHGKGSSAQSLALHHPNVPLQLLNSSLPRCSLMPEFMRIKWSGLVWQNAESSSGKKLLLYSAAYDNRTKTEPKGGAVRILTLLQSSNITPSELPWCLLWYNGSLMPHSPSTDRLQSYVLTCPAAHRSQPPWGVSIVAEECSPAHNLLKVVSSSEREASSKGAFSRRRVSGGSSNLPEVGICGPALFYYQDDFSVRLVEWLELLRALGVSKVFLYVTRVHPNIEKVLAYYEHQGFVDVTQFNYPPPYVDEPLLRRLWTLVERKQMFSLENIYFTDCLLRNMHRYRFLAHFDPDELPVLLQHRSLPHLVQHLLNVTQDWQEPPPSYMLQWQYFPSDVAPSKELSGASALSGEHSMSSHLHLLGHDCKLVSDPDAVHYNFKSVYDTFDTTAAFSHRSVACASGACFNSQEIDLNIAYLGHFSGQCGERCEHDPLATVVEPALHRYREEVEGRVTAVWRTLHLLPQYSPPAP